MSPNILLNPGPTNVHPDVKQALITPNMNHREPEFTSVMHALIKVLVKLADGGEEYDCVPFVCSGTGANEAILSTINDGTLLALCAGRYGERMAKIAQQLGVDVVALYFDPFTGIDLARIEQVLASTENITHLCFVHHETTTSLLAPLYELCALAKRYHVITIADTISSLLGHEISLRQAQLDYCTLTSNKCLESVPGISFVLAKRSLLASLEGCSKSYYFDLFAQWDRVSNQDGLSRFTMATQLFYAAHEAVQRLCVEGVANRAKRYARLKTYLATKMLALGIKPYSFGDKPTANILQMYHIPADMTYQKLHDMAKQQDVTLYTDSHTLSKGFFFLATMGAIDEQDIDYFVNGLSKSLSFHNVASA